MVRFNDYIILNCINTRGDRTMTETDIIDRARFLTYENPNINKQQAIKQALAELESDELLRDSYTLFDVDYDTYINDMARAL